MQAQTEHVFTYLEEIIVIDEEEGFGGKRKANTPHVSDDAKRYVCIYVCMYVCMYMYVCMFVCMYV
jgi:hypothetical protein